jgi:hypothetical protein
MREKAESQLEAVRQSQKENRRKVGTSGAYTRSEYSTIWQQDIKLRKFGRNVNIFRNDNDQPRPGLAPNI